MGVAIDQPCTTVTLACGPGHPVLLAGPTITSAVEDNFAVQLLRQGCKVLYLRSSKSGPIHLSLPPEKRWVLVKQSEDPCDAMVAWLAALSELAELRRQTCRVILDTLLPDVATHLGKCIQPLLSRVAEEPKMFVHSGRPRHQALLACVEILERHAKVSAASPTGLRRACWLIGQLVWVLREFSHAVSGTWQRKAVADESGSDGTRRELVVIEMAETGALSVQLRALLAVGALLAAEQQCRARCDWESDLDKLDLKVRRRRHAAKEQRGRIRKERVKPPSRPLDLPRRPRHRSLLDNREDEESAWWKAHPLLEPNCELRLCVLVAGALGPHHDPLLKWFQPGQVAAHHTLVATAPRLPAASAASRSLGGFRSFVVPPLEPAAADLFTVATGIRVPTVTVDEGHAAGSSLHLTLTGSRVEAGRIVIWPPRSEWLEEHAYGAR